MISEDVIRVSEALKSLWRPKVGDGFRGPDNCDDRQMLIDEALHFDGELWARLVTLIKQKLDGNAQIEVESDSVSIYLPDVKNFSINFELTSFNGDDYSDEFDIDDIDGMSREEAIEYLSEIEDLPSFDYVTVSARTYVSSTVGIIEDDNFSGLLDSIAEGLQKTPEVYQETIKAVSIELQQKAEKQREIDNRIKAKKEEEARMLAEFEAEIVPHLVEAGWSGKYRVSMNFNNFVLSLQLTSYDECRYESVTQSDVVSKIGELVNFATAYRSLKRAGGLPILHGNQVRVADWKEISGQ